MYCESNLAWLQNFTNLLLVFSSSPLTRGSGGGTAVHNARESALAVDGEGGVLIRKGERLYTIVISEIQQIHSPADRRRPTCASASALAELARVGTGRT